MNGIDYLQMINDLDDELVMAANQTPVKRRTPVRVWISMAAGVLVALGIGFMVNMTHPTTSDNNMTAFTFQGYRYVAAEKEDYDAHGIVSPTDASGRCMPEIGLTEKDLGDAMGDIRLTVDGETVMCHLYRYRDFPEDICVAEVAKGEYHLFISKEN